MLSVVKLSKNSDIIYGITDDVDGSDIRYVDILFNIQEKNRNANKNQSKYLYRLSMIGQNILVVVWSVLLIK